MVEGTGTSDTRHGVNQSVKEGSSFLNKKKLSQSMVSNNADLADIV